MHSQPDATHERRLLRGVLMEALELQDRKRTALEEQLTDSSSHADLDEKARAKALKRAQAVPKRLAEVDAAEERLLSLKASLSERGVSNLGAVRQTMEAELGLSQRLAIFDVDAAGLAQWGRPDGFDGLVIPSPRGVPILVGRKAFSDSTLRRVSRGTDLWFTVREGSGSRVLLRTSMCRGLARSPRECMEMAADLAAHFSSWRRPYRDEDEDVEVMFTDSRHVAKFGGRVGQMKQKKRLGTLWARPERVAEVAREAQEEQGWL